MDVGSEGDITGSPTEGDGDPDGGQGPGKSEGVFLRGVGVGKDPNNQETESIETQPGDGSLDDLGKEKDEEGTEELTKVGASDHDLGVSTLHEDVLCKGGRELGLEITMGEEGDGVTGDQPDELAAGEDDLDTEDNRLTKVGETMADLAEERVLLEGLKTPAVIVIGL